VRAGVRCVCVCVCVRFILKLHNCGAVLRSQCNVFSREKESGKE
jgi:hypothetical protein